MSANIPQPPAADAAAMRPRDWAWVVGVLLGTWLFDFISKSLVYQGLQLPPGTHIQLGPFYVVQHLNPGMMLGSFSTLPPIIRNVSLCTLGAFLFSLYCATQYLMVQRFFWLRVGLSLFMAGILGNISCRVLFGSVVDILVVDLGFFRTAAFNAADLVQWVAWPILVVQIIKHAEYFWPERDKRGSKKVLSQFQNHHTAVLLSIATAFCLLSGMLGYSFLKNALLSPEQSDLLLEAFLTSHIMTSLVFFVALFLFGRRLSTRIAGPLYALKRFVNSLHKGAKPKFQLRKGDHFAKYLHTLAQDLKKSQARKSARPAKRTPRNALKRPTTKKS